MANQTLPCPHCGCSLEVTPQSVVVAVRSLDRHGRSSTTFWEPPWSSLRSVLPSGKSGQSFEQVATPFFPAGRQELVSGDQSLQPGEHHISKAYRERAQSDLVVPLLANLVSTGIVGLSSLGICLSIRLTGLRSAIFGYNWRAIVQYWPVVPPAAMLATMAGLWFKRQLPDLLDDDKLIAAVQEHERRPEPAPMPAQAPVVHRVQGEFKDEKTGTISFFDVEVNKDAWYWFCADVDSGACNFSQRAAKDHGIEPDQWGKIVDQFWANAWLVSRGSERAAPKYNKKGALAIAAYGALYSPIGG